MQIHHSQNAKIKSQKESCIQYNESPIYIYIYNTNGQRMERLQCTLINN